MQKLNILAISSAIPIPGRAGGFLRYFEILCVLGRVHNLTVCAYEESRFASLFGAELTARARDGLAAQGVSISDGTNQSIKRLLGESRFDIVLLEHFESGKAWLKWVRLLQPDALIMIDSIDLAFLRHRSKANTTDKEEDRQRASEVEALELGVYEASDVVITVSDAERRVLSERLPGLRIYTIPLLFPEIRSGPVEAPGRDSGFSMLFIGDFLHDPNVDAILWFLREILPSVRARIPDAVLKIAGGNAPTEVREAAGENVEVLGYVEDLGALYAGTDLSLAPMRYGAGLKSKIAESLFHGVPVVCHRASLEGFDLIPGEEIMVADSAEEFANAIVRMALEPQLRRELAARGSAHVRERFSVGSVERQLIAMFAETRGIPVKKLSLSARTAWHLRDLWNRHIAWRFRS